MLEHWYWEDKTVRVEQLSLFDLPPVKVEPTACLSVGKFAKVLNSKGFVIGEKRLFEKLRALKMLNNNNVPFQCYMEKGYFKVIRQPYQKGPVHHVYLKVLITPVGQHYLEDLFANEAACNRD